MQKNAPYFLTLILIFTMAGGLAVWNTTSFAEETGKDVHEFLYESDPFPSAQQCKACHPVHYKEWSVSPHAYAQVSPVFNSMQAKITKLTNGTNGDFCIRCHTPVGMAEHEPLFTSNLERSQVSYEGISCIVCHRRDLPYGKVSARFTPKKGNIFEPVYGPFDGDEVKRVIESGEFDVVTEPVKDGRPIHREAKQFYQITTAGFCGSCHDVNHVTGFRLEEAFSDYKSSPAAQKGISCQDCHMGKVPGIPSGYEEMPAAIVGGIPTKPRQKTDHMFVGPDYSVVHPALYPHNSAVTEIAALNQWLKFNFTAGWGTDEFEDTVTPDQEFPEPWTDADARYEAREVLQENLELLELASQKRKQLLQNGYQLGDIRVDKMTNKEIRFQVEVQNATEGHNVPTGFDAERVVYLEVTVTDKNGKVVFKSGDLDPNGDLRDLHSVYVHNGELKRDPYLFSLQSKFLVRTIRGGDREQVLAVNSSADPLPFIRPPVHATFLTGRPADSRKHRRTIPPLGNSWAKYKVNADDLSGSEGPYQATVKLIAGMVPVNLVYEIQDVGFDYGMSPREVADAVVKGYQVLWERNVLLEPGVIDKND
ncbi:MAG: multiheme c-type cytochrome [Candidatus Omnitrophota bacterium]